MSKSNNRITRVTVTVETASGDAFTVAQQLHSDVLMGDNPRFIVQQFEDCLSTAERRMSDVIMLNYGGEPQR